MTDTISAGTDVAAGTYRCTGCGAAVSVPASQLPPCPSCGNGDWEVVPSKGGETDKMRH